MLETQIFVQLFGAFLFASGALVTVGVARFIHWCVTDE